MRSGLADEGGACTGHIGAVFTPQAVDGVALKDDDLKPVGRTGEGSTDGQEPRESGYSPGLTRRPATRYVLSPSRDRSPLEAITGAAPGIGVLRHYRRSWLRPDLYAGISVVAYLVPQVMAYTALVGVPPVAGLADRPGRH